jgi:SAM-dependent methyltransferase
MSMQKKWLFAFKSKKMADLKQVFTVTYHNNLWGGNESVSGPGSSLEQTEIIRTELARLIKNYQIKTIIDAPCGDFFWLKEVVANTYHEIDSYLGLDIVAELIESNRSKYAKEKIDFKCADLTKDTLPQADLIISRDCFIHLSYQNIYKALRNFKRSKSNYLLISSYTNHPNQNIKKAYSLEARTINIARFPFCIKKNLEVINENCTEFDGAYNDKSLILIKIAQINLFKLFLSFTFVYLSDFIQKYFIKIMRRIKRLIPAL